MDEMFGGDCEEIERARGAHETLIACGASVSAGDLDVEAEVSDQE